MADTFLININCSKIVADSDEVQYTMFIDTTKMSIVYELVEWIRWMFSLKTCLYLTHNNSVIHELEDIQLLQKLQSFEVKPCGRPQCVHKKLYRSLLKNLNLFTYWKGTEVHKYFLHKLDLMDKKLSQGNINTSSSTLKIGSKVQESFEDCNVTKMDNSTSNNLKNNKSFLDENILSESCNDSLPLFKRKESFRNTESKCKIKKKSSNEADYYLESQMLENYLNNPQIKSNCYSEPCHTKIDNSMWETKKTIDNIETTVSSNASVKNHLSITEKKPGKSCVKPLKKCSKPFSLGEILFNLREDFEKKKIKLQENSTANKKNKMLKEEELDNQKMEMENTFLMENEFNVGKKKKRVRKRKSKKQNLENEEIITPVSDKNNSQYTFNILKSNSGIKPNHIRFDFEDEDNLMETECLEHMLKTENENKFPITAKEITSPFSNTKPENLLSVLNTTNHIGGSVQVSTAVKNSKIKLECPSAVDSQITPEAKLIDLNEEPCISTFQTNIVPKNFESNSLNPDLNGLLSLKDKFKNAVVIERFF